MGKKTVAGSSFSINREVNIIGSDVTTQSTKCSIWPKLTAPTPDIASGFSVMLPSLIGGIPMSAGGTVNAFHMAALGCVAKSAKIGLSPNPAGSGYTASYINILQRLMTGAYFMNGNVDQEAMKKAAMSCMSQMVEHASPAYLSWKQVLAEYMERAALLGFLKGVPSAVCAMIGDPVNANTGNFIYEKEDLLVKSPIPLCFKRSYNGLDDRTGSMGRGWRHNYEIQLLTEEDCYVILWGDGREEPYLREGDGNLFPLFGGGNRLKPEGDGFLYETKEKTMYVFDRKGKLLRRTDAKEQGLEFLYDEYGRLGSVVNGIGCFLSYQYDHYSGQLIQVVDHVGRNVSLTYELGRLKEVKNSGGACCQYTYDGDKRLHRIRNPRGIYTVENQYDMQGRTAKQIYADGGILTCEYQEDVNRTVVTEQNGNKTVYVHDHRYRNIRTVYIDGEERFLYNRQNQLVEKTDKNGNRTRYVYDDKGNVGQIIYADGEKYSMTYDGESRLLTLSVNGITKLKNTYDQRGNLIKSTDALGRSQTIVYNEKGAPVKLTCPDKSEVAIGYDNWGNIIRLTDNCGNCTIYEYDVFGRIIRTTDGNGNTTEFTYDGDSRIICVTNAEGNNRLYEYTENGEITKVTDFDGAVTLWEYNPMNQVMAVIRSDGKGACLEYDLMQNITGRKLPTGDKVSYEYDGLSRLVQIRLPSGGTIRYEYDPNGNRRAVTGPEGDKTVMQYDERNRLTKLADPKGAVTRYEYDMEGRLISITNDGIENHIYTYDEAGQLIREKDALGNVMRYEYNTMGKVCAFTDSRGQTTVYDYEPGGRLARVAYPDGGYEICSYDKAGNLARRQDHNGDYLEFTYDCLNQLVKIESSFGQETCYTYNSFGKVIPEADVLSYGDWEGYLPGEKLMPVIDPGKSRMEEAMGEMDFAARVDERSVAFAYKTLRQLIQIQEYAKTAQTALEPADILVLIENMKRRRFCYTATVEGGDGGVSIAAFREQR